MNDSNGPDRAGQREVVTHALAVEARNALARVELSVGELAGTGQSPRVLEVASTLQTVVGELDQILGTIGRLHAPARLPVGPAQPLRPMLDQAIGRASQVAFARGLSWDVDTSSLDTSSTNLPRAVLERLSLAFLRTVLASCERGTMISLRAEQVDEDLDVAVALVRSRAADLTEARRERVDLEAQLAEWGGALSVDDEATRYSMRIPLGGADA